VWIKHGPDDLERRTRIAEMLEDVAHDDRLVAVGRSVSGTELALYDVYAARFGSRRSPPRGFNA
jgi:hypothetical protein